MPILTPEERVGTTLAEKYRLDRILGQGGFGTVYAGVHEWTGRPVATKVLDHTLARQDEFVTRFLKEARAAAKIAHPNVVDVLDMGREPDGTVYLVLELLRGEELSAVLKRAKLLPLEEAFAHVLPIVDALAEAHARGIVHRDLKPANIFLSVDSFGRTIPKLLDFGIAKDQADAALTHTGQVWGTPHFMSPEQASGGAEVGPPMDVWAMGVLLFRCVTGQLPFHGTSAAAVLTKVLTTRAPTIRSVSPDTPEAIASAIDHALEPDPNERYPDMGAFLGALLSAAAPLDVLPSSLAEMLARRDLARSSTIVSSQDLAATLDEAPRAPEAEEPPLPPSLAAPPSTRRVRPPATEVAPTEVLPTPPTPLILRTSAPPRPTSSKLVLAAAGGGLVAFLAAALLVIVAVRPDEPTPERAVPGAASAPVEEAPRVVSTPPPVAPLAGAEGAFAPGPEDEEAAGEDDATAAEAAGEESAPHVAEAEPTAAPEASAPVAEPEPRRRRGRLRATTPTARGRRSPAGTSFSTGSLPPSGGTTRRAGPNGAPIVD